MKKKNLYAILMAGTMLVTIFSAFSVNATDATANSILSKNPMNACSSSGSITVHVNREIPAHLGIAIAKVEVYEGNEMEGQGRTDPYGDVTIDNLDTGLICKNYVVKVERTSYNDGEASVRLTPGNPNVDITIHLSLKSKSKTIISNLLQGFPFLAKLLNIQ